MTAPIFYYTSYDQTTSTDPRRTKGVIPSHKMKTSPAVCAHDIWEAWGLPSDSTEPFTSSWRPRTRWGAHAWDQASTVPGQEESLPPGDPGS